MKTTPAFNHPVLTKIAELGKQLKVATERYNQLDKKVDELREKQDEATCDVDTAKDECIERLTELASDIGSDYREAEGLFEHWRQSVLKEDEVIVEEADAVVDYRRVLEEKDELTTELLTLCLEIANA